MAQPKDDETATPEQPASQEPAGQVEFDSRGNSVWRWARDVLDSTSILLKRLENDKLEIEPTRKVPIMRDGKTGQAGKHAKHARKSARADLSVSAETGERDSGGGFD